MKTGLTDHARHILEAARFIALSSGQQQAGVEDLMLALLTDSRGSVAMGALLECGITVGIAAQLQDEARRKQSPEDPVDLSGLTSIAINEAASLRHSYAGPEHLLLALVGTSFSDVVVDYLSGRGVTPGMVRKEVLAILGTGDPAASD